jgi:hypothetical protein
LQVSDASTQSSTRPMTSRNLITTTAWLGLPKSLRVLPPSPLERLSQQPAHGSTPLGQAFTGSEAYSIRVPAGLQPETHQEVTLWLSVWTRCSVHGGETTSITITNLGKFCFFQPTCAALMLASLILHNCAIWPACLVFKPATVGRSSASSLRRAQVPPLSSAVNNRSV